MPKNKIILNKAEFEPGLPNLVNNTRNLFIKIYGYEPRFYAKGSPRIEFLGNFTDHGKKLNAIGGCPNIGLVAAATQRNDRKVFLWTSIHPQDPPLEINLDLLPDVQDNLTWSNHQISILKQLYIDHPKEYLSLKGADICLDTNVSPGVSMATSTAAEASFFLVFLRVNNLSLPKREIIKTERAAELKIFHGCGWLDHVTSHTPVKKGYGIRLFFYDPGDGVLCETTPVNVDLDKFGYQWVVIYAKAFVRNIISTGYTVKAEKIQLGLKMLSEISTKEMHQLNIADRNKFIKYLKTRDEEMAGVVNHVLSENQRVLKAEKLFNQLNQTKPDSSSSKTIIKKIGNLLNACAQSSIGYMGVPTGIHRLPSFDPFLKQIRLSGAIGARNMGGGFTPTMLALTEKNDTQHFINTLKGKLLKLCPEIDFNITPISVGLASRVLNIHPASGL